MNLLTKPLIRVEVQQSIVKMNLPELLASLGKDLVTSLPGIQRHQEDAFHIFLCYLAGAVLSRSNLENPSQKEDFWREGLRQLAGRNDDDAWTLIVKDPTKPAFMQPPAVSEKDFEQNFKKKPEMTPDALDILITSKNHDLKLSRAIASEPEAWIYALVNLQTMSGYILKHQGIARMNSGFGSRPCIELVYCSDLADRWMTNVKRLLSLRNTLLRPPWPYKADGIVLTWLPAWDRKTSLSLAELDPFFIEISRGVRLFLHDGALTAQTSTEHAPRIEAKSEKGVLGDPWIPVAVRGSEKESALTVLPSGFTPGLLRDLLFEDGYRLEGMQKPFLGREDESCHFFASVLVRGQGKTSGYHTAKIPVPATISKRLFRPSPERDQLATFSKRAVYDAGVMQNRVLKSAVLSFLEADSKSVGFDSPQKSQWLKEALRRFSEAWHEDFFPWLWRILESPDPDSTYLEWLRSLRDKAGKVLNNSMALYPGHAGRRYRMQVLSKHYFSVKLEKTFPQL